MKNGTNRIYKSDNMYRKDYTVKFIILIPIYLCNIKKTPY